MTLIDNNGVNSISVGVSKGIGRCECELTANWSKKLRDTHQKLGQVLVVQPAGLQYPLAEVHPVGILFNAQEQFSSCSRAVDKRSPEGLEAL